jgi:hypothetical protein
MKTLKEIIENRQLYESYPIQLLDNETVNSKDEFINALAIVNKYLQQLESEVINDDTTFEKDLTDVKYYINNMLYTLTKN